MDTDMDMNNENNNNENDIILKSQQKKKEMELNYNKQIIEYMFSGKKPKQQTLLEESSDEDVAISQN
eukprot:CAMPEP_0114672862 /NCGR_PEP_ID=MMETSP0191-20121206/43634_1 /TAXON_ID=126664 /ORGANISM="Sorites sp." /LENGTH=66 /DNA_ID=CAMNT_0001936233 /DNA_START=448 /DNA_END=648 /DNA_ORIENTATION=+